MVIYPRLSKTFAGKKLVMNFFDRWAQVAIVYYTLHRLGKTNEEIKAQKAVLATRLRRCGPKMQKATTKLIYQIQAEARGASHTETRMFHYGRAHQLKGELLQAQAVWRETAQTLAKPYGRAVRRRVQLTKLLNAAQKLGS